MFYFHLRDMKKRKNRINHAGNLVMVAIIPASVIMFLIHYIPHNYEKNKQERMNKLRNEWDVLVTMFDRK